MSIKILGLRTFSKLTKFSNINPKSVSREDARMPYVDPTIEIQKFLKAPLFKENETPFKPSLSEMKEAEKIFDKDPPHQKEIKYLCSAVAIDHFPKFHLPEVVFIGQTNVGKSTLLNALFRKYPEILVKTSSKPGHTKKLNFFEVNKKLILVDVPGYGHQKVMPKGYIESVETYLKTRTNLKRTFLIIDCQAGISDWDLVAIKMLEEFRIQYALVMTKIDLAPVSKRLVGLVHLQNIRDQYSSPCCFPQPFLISSWTYEGLAYLQCFIAYVTSNITLKNG